MIVCIDLNIDPKDDNQETLDEIRKHLKESLKELKKAKLINRFRDVGITFWRMY